MLHGLTMLTALPLRACYVHGFHSTIIPPNGACTTVLRPCHVGEDHTKFITGSVDAHYVYERSYLILTESLSRPGILSRNSRFNFADFHFCFNYNTVSISNVTWQVSLLECTGCHFNGRKDEF